jgi:hypothetical protein
LRAWHVRRAKNPVVAEQVGVYVFVAHLAAFPHIVIEIFFTCAKRT